jgi:hypothetical protein
MQAEGNPGAGRNAMVTIARTVPWCEYGAALCAWGGMQSGLRYKLRESWADSVPARRLGALALIGAVLVFLISTGTALAFSPKDEDFHISAVAEFRVIHNYSGERSHKAFAVGPGGVWGYAFNSSSATLASKIAVKTCNRILHTSPDKSLARKDCVLFDVDGKRTGKATPIGIPFGTVEEGPDLPYEAGSRWEPTTMARRGNLLFLHGCNKIGEIDGWYRSWINFYRASGFRVIMPDSFIEPRDKESCGGSPSIIDIQTRNLKLRVAQTLRTIETIHRKYPGEAIYVHGHSEGGFIAQALGEKVDGIIVTGTSCGFGDSAAYWVGKGTPVLVIAGTRDAEHIPTGRTPKALSAYCNTVRGAGKLTAVSVPGMGHLAAPWWPAVRQSLARFLDVEPIRVLRRKSENVAFPGIPTKVLQDYLNAAKPKALAGNERGNWSWNGGAESKLDAEETALFDCDQVMQADAYLDTSHQHACALIDVDGKRPVE